jgi:acyl-CoA synthetase (AMP-forming)/AMP-acid ligase II
MRQADGAATTGVADARHATATGSTLADHLRAAAEDAPERTAYVFRRGDRSQRELTIGDVHREASRVASELTVRGARGERVLLLQASPLDYIVSFFGALLAGATPVSTYPLERGRLDATLPPVDAACADSGARFVLGTSATEATVARNAERAPALTEASWVATDMLDERPPVDPHASSGAGDLAYIQYTSGSTTAPRGVMISHRNFLANIAAQQQMIPVTPQSRIVSWLPLSHDMGFVGPVLHPVVTGCVTMLLSAIAFVVRPERWLTAISDFRGTIGGGPNFAYELVARRVSPELAARLDLRCWEAAMNGAEPIRADTLDRFMSVCAPAGLRREALLPAFGMSEVVCMATGGQQPRPLIRSFDRGSLARGLATPSGDGPAAQRLVGCGAAGPRHEIRIVDPDRHVELADGEVGEVWISGPSVALGYWARPELSRRSFGARLGPDGAGPFLRSGDLGFVWEGELFVTGRLKEAIVIRGLNHLPHEIEATVAGCHPSIDPDGVAAFTAGERGGAEACVVVIELDDHELDRERLANEVIRAVVGTHGVPVAEVAFGRRGQLARTRSGKLQRGACRLAFEAGTFEALTAGSVA